MKRVVVYRRDLLCTRLELFSRGLALGFLSLGFVCGMLGIASRVAEGLQIHSASRFAFVVGGALALVIPFALPISIWMQFPEELAERRRAKLAGIAYGTGFVSIPFCAVIINLLLNHPSGLINILLQALGLLAPLAIVVGSAVGGVLVSKFFNARIQYVQQFVNPVCPGCL